MNKDKLYELKKYNLQARETLKKDSLSEKVIGYEKFHFCFQNPLIKFEELINKHISPGMNVIELASGQGNYTGFIAAQKAEVFSTDISLNSLKVASKYLNNFDNVIYQVADMENLPFKSNIFDALVIAGSLSYGNLNIIQSEINRVLKKNGLLIVVDSLNENPIYKFKRLFDVLRKKRTKSSYLNLPKMKTIDNFSKDFEILDLSFYGSITWLLNFFPNRRWVKSFSLSFDNAIKCKKSAFMFTFVGKKNF